MNKSKIFIISTLFLCGAQLLVILLSWIISAILPEVGVRSLLSNAGLRFMLTSYTSTFSMPIFAYILTSAFGIGTLIKSNIHSKIANYHKGDYNEQLGIKVFISELIIACVLCLLMALLPNSPFLSVDGTLFPGPFIKSVFLLIMLFLFLGSMSFLFITDKLRSYNEIEKTICYGIKKSVPISIISFLTIQLIKMYLFILG